MNQPAPLDATDRPSTQSAASLAFGLFPRLLALILLFATELLVLSIWLDNSDLVDQGGGTAIVGHWGAWAVRIVVGFAAIFLTFAYLKKTPALTAISTQAERTPVGRRLLAAHLTAMAGFAALCWALYGDLLALPPGVAVGLWLVAGTAAIASAALALLPLPLWSQLLRATGSLWVSAFALVIAACVAGNYIRLLWRPAAHLTFFLVKACLTPFVSSIVSDPSTMTLGTPRFDVIIAPECSGFEGVGLILAFSVCWLWLFRRECRFPQALLLIPAGAATIYLLNAVRITALILIGDAGAPQIAAGGFHSQAGWIAFNAVALGFCVVATRVPWLRIAPAEPLAATVRPSENPTAAWLLPFLAILVAGMIGTAASSDFEWLYPLRFFAAAAVLFAMRSRYRTLDWSFTWLGPAIGVAVFALWIGLDALLKSPTADPMPHALAAASAPLRTGWVAFRILAAVTTVPIAEELAFRGFLLRRILSPDFEAVPLRTFTWPALIVSSLAFGLLHGHLWLAGTAAGLLYAWAMLRRGRIGEAVIAHATTNALLASYVLAFHQWRLW